MKIELNQNDFLFYSFQRLIKIYLVIICILGLFRLSFVAYFADKNVYHDYFMDLLHAFYLGWKYDTIVATYSLLLPFLFFWSCSLLKSKKLFNFLNSLFSVYFFVVVLAIIFISISDLGFYSFFQDHLNILFFGFFEDDTEAILLSIWKNYPLEYGLIGLVIFLVFLFFILKNTFRFLAYDQAPLFNAGAGKFIFFSICCFFLLLGGARGGYGMMVLAPKYADFSKNLFVNQVALNGIITFEKAFKLRRERTSLNFNMAKTMGYGNNIHQAFSDYLGIDASPTNKEFLVRLLERKTPVHPKAEQIKPHVIVILMESFGAHWLQYNTESFDFMGPLKKHFEEDSFFKNFISSGNGTIGSLMVVGSNIPYRKGARFLSESRYLQLPLPSAAHVPYRERGYETSFVYSGKLGWRDIGKYFTYQNYHHVEGETHMRDALQLTGIEGSEWGLHDEHFFNFILSKLKKAKHSQFILGLTTSNHPPFTVPQDFQAPKLTLPSDLEARIAREKDLFLLRFRAFQYANYKLAEFIEKIKKSELAKNTIIAVTGDHNFWGFMNYGKKEAFSKYTVPFYLYIPDHLKPININLARFGSHEDIMPTLYNLSLSETSYIAFGEDLFGRAPSISMNGEIYASDEGVIWEDKSYDWDGIPLIFEEANKNEHIQLKKQMRSTLTVADYFLQQASRSSNKQPSK